MKNMKAAIKGDAAAAECIRRGPPALNYNVIIFEAFRPHRNFPKHAIIFKMKMCHKNRRVTKCSTNLGF